MNELKSPHDDSSGLDISTGSNLGGMASEPPLGSLDRERDGNMPQHHMLIGVAEDIGVSPVSGSEGAKAGRMQREVNMHEQSGKYVCPTCGKPFDRPYRLQRHLQIHNPNRPKVSCHLCDKSFTRVDTLENHMKCLHSNDRPFKCTFAGCPKSFPLQSALVHHLKVCMNLLIPCYADFLVLAWSALNCVISYYGFFILWFQIKIFHLIKTFLTMSPSNKIIQLSSSIPTP